MRETPDAHVQRILRCVKMRGANIDTRSFCLMHAGGSFILNLPMTRASCSLSAPGTEPRGIIYTDGNPAEGEEIPCRLSD